MGSTGVCLPFLPAVLSVLIRTTLSACMGVPSLALVTPSLLLFGLLDYSGWIDGNAQIGIKVAPF